MVEVDEQSVKEYDDRQAVVTGIVRWLKYRSYENYNTGDLIEELELCGENGEYPWEVMPDALP